MTLIFFVAMPSALAAADRAWLPVTPLYPATPAPEPKSASAPEVPAEAATPEPTLTIAGKKSRPSAPEATRPSCTALSATVSLAS